MASFTTSRTTRQRAVVVAGLALVGLTVSACTSGGGSTGSEDSAAVAVYEDFESQSGAAREAALVEAAQEEGVVVVYTTAPGYDAMFEAFSEKYGIEVEKYVGRSDTVLQRTVQEYEAGVYAVDVFEDENAFLLAKEDGFTYPYVNGELTSQIENFDASRGFIPWRLSVPAVAWNTDLVSDDQVPEEIADLADPFWDGKLTLDAGAWNWYAAVWEYYSDQGWTDEELQTFFETLVDYSSPQPTSIAMTELLSAGEYSMGTSVLTIITDLNASNGAPVAWNTADGDYVKPVVVFPEGATLMRNAPHPHAALLLMDFVLQEGAPLLDEGFWPSPVQPEDGTLHNVDPADFLWVSHQIMDADRDKWISEWDALVSAK